MSKPQKKRNFFDIVSVASTNFADCHIRWDFVSAGLLLLNLAAAGDAITIDYSFDGVEKHGEMNSARADAGISRDSCHECGVFLRLKSPGSAVQVRVESWA